MKGKFFPGLALWILATIQSEAQTTEFFNSRQQVRPEQLKSYLQDRCWVLSHFEILAATSGSIPEGDGALVNTDVSGSIATPLLNVKERLSVSFKYNYENKSEGQGSLKLVLTDIEHREMKVLDVLPISAANNPLRYDRTFSFPAEGVYKLMISYSGDASAKFLLDELAFSAPYYFAGGCNRAPVAKADFITGKANRTASGNLTQNDKDPNASRLTAYIIKGSSDGTLRLDADNTFYFTPNADFTGTYTSFTYRACDTDDGNLCSDETTVRINFPTDAIPAISLVDLAGKYVNPGKVEVKWITGFEENVLRYEIERSYNGLEWKKAGVLKSQGTSSAKFTYNFIDDVGTRIINKKDIYYRLKQVNNDQQVFFSRLLIIRVYNTKSLKMVTVVPNPVKKDIGLQMELNEDAMVVMKILKNNGVEMVRKTVKTKAGLKSWVIEGSSQLTPGFYVLEIIVNSKERMLVKLIKE
ncbi:MAG TPA: Ig-like domain-containing protein [Flavitalea sp.]|nr:Ig-like domain-containing protein [Flavitalea sp.]